MKDSVSVHQATTPRLMTMMESPPPERQQPAGEPSGGEPGIVLSRDLFFTARVTATAEALGYRMLQIGDPARVVAVLEAQRPRVVVLDLTAGVLVEPGALAAYRQATGPTTWYIAVGPHVQADLLDAARQAGCQV